MDADSRPFHECLPRTEDPFVVACWIAHTIAIIGRYDHAFHFNTTQVGSRNGSKYRHMKNKKKTINRRTLSNNLAQQGLPAMDLRQPHEINVSKTNAKSLCQNLGVNQVLAEIRSKLPTGSRRRFQSGEKYFEQEAAGIPIDRSVVDAGKLLANVLFPMFNPTSGPKWRMAMTSFIQSIDKDGPDAPNFTMAFTILAGNNEILGAVEFIVKKTGSEESLFDPESGRVNGRNESPTRKCRLTLSLNGVNEHGQQQQQQQSSIDSSESFIYQDGSRLKNLSSRRQHSTPLSPYHSFSKNQALSLFSSSSVDPISYSFPPYPSTPTAHLKPPSVATKNHRDTNKKPSIPSEMARTSGRIRKPTLRAMESNLSVLGKGKGKRPRKASPAREEDTGGKYILYITHRYYSSVQADYLDCMYSWRLVYDPGGQTPRRDGRQGEAGFALSLQRRDRAGRQPVTEAGDGSHEAGFQAGGES